MEEEQKNAYYERYKKAKAKGIKFWPDIIYKDMLMVFALFLVVILLATFVGVANEPKADPNDASYIPRPEWYFLWLFEMLKYFPGKLEWVGTVIIPGIGVLVLFLLPFIDRNPRRYFRKRRIANLGMTVVVIGIVALTVIAAVTTPKQEEEAILASTLPEQITAGEELYSLHCVECHGTEGEGGEIKGVEGLEGVVLYPINSRDVMYTFTDDTLYNTINYGQQDLGMPPFGRAFGGELGPSEIEYIVAFMRYTWDDRVEMPEEAVQTAAIPVLGPNEVPSYEVHLAPLFKRYCLSCHRPGKKNNNYLMRTYEEVIQSGENAPNLKAGDLECNLILMINRKEIEAGGPMPPTKALKPEIIEIITRWVLGGMPNTAAEAAAATLPGVIPPPEVITPTITLTATQVVTSTITAVPGVTVTPTP